MSIISSSLIRSKFFIYWKLINADLSRRWLITTQKRHFIYWQRVIIYSTLRKFLSLHSLLCSNLNPSTISRHIFCLSSLTLIIIAFFALFGQAFALISACIRAVAHALRIQRGINQIVWIFVQLWTIFFFKQWLVQGIIKNATQQCLESNIYVTYLINFFNYLNYYIYINHLKNL